MPEDLPSWRPATTGKIIRETSSQIAYVADYYRYYAGIADKIEAPYLPIDKPDMDVCCAAPSASWPWSCRGTASFSFRP